MNAARAALHHSSLHISHWEDAVRDATFKYNHIFHTSTGSLPTTLWHGRPPNVPQYLLLGQLGITPHMANRATVPKLHHRSITVRYLYATDPKHSVVLVLRTNKTMRIRTVNFNAYHKNRDPLATTTASFKAFTPNPTPEVITTTTPPPIHHGQARHYPDATLCELSQNAELDLLYERQVITWIPDHKLPPYTKPIPLTIGNRYKRDSEGQITKRKARYAARGDKMIPHVHFDLEKTTTYMADKTTVRLLFAIAAACRLYIEHIDIKAAYLHEKFAHNGKDTVYVRQHPRFDGSYKHACRSGRLDKNMYGTPSAGHAYLQAIFATLAQHKFLQSEADPCLFHRSHQHDTTFVAISTDDFTVVASTQALLDKIAQILADTYKIKRLGEHKTFLGWTVCRQPSGDINVSQPNAINYVVHKAGMEHNNVRKVKIRTQQNKQLNKQGQMMSISTGNRSPSAVHARRPLSAIRHPLFAARRMFGADQ